MIRSLRSSCAAAALCALSVPSLAASAARAVVPGVSYERDTRSGQSIHIMRVMPGPLISVRPRRASGSVTQRTPLTQIMRRNRADGALVGINGDFFNFAGGYPSGALILGSEILHEPEPSRSALGILASGRFEAFVGRLSGEWSLEDGTTFPFSGLNRQAEQNETILYTPRYGSPTPAASGNYDVMIRLPSAQPLVPNVPLEGTVVARRAGGGLAPTGRSLVLAGVGGGIVDRLSTNLTLGTRVTITPSVSSLPSDLTHAIGGGPLRVDNGVAIQDSPEGFTFSQVATRTARSAVGQRANGQMLFVVAEGPTVGRRGMTTNDLARYMAALGARTAVAMDSGGSAGLALRGGLVNRIAGSERWLSNALVVQYAGIQMTDPLPLVSPNADGSRDRTRVVVYSATPGLMTAALLRPNGTRARTIVRSSVGPTPRSIPIQGRSVAVPNGRYRLVAKLIPADGGTPSVVERALRVDRTLGHLALRRGSGRLQIGFRLSRPARVTAVVLNSRGRTVATLMRRRQYARGGQTRTWDLRVRNTRLRPGVYRVVMTSRTDGADRIARGFRVTR